jgi:ferrochelatase
MSRKGDLPCTAVLLLAFGGPRALAEVPLFLERLFGRKPSPAQIEGLQRRYQAIGSASPLPEMTLRQARTLEKALKERGKPLQVFVGMRYSHPLIAETLDEIKKRGASRIILVSLSPYRSSFTSEDYYAEVRRVVATWDKRMELVQVADWHTHPTLCAAWAERIAEGMEKIAEKKEKIPVIFTAHSLPLDHAANSPYVRQLEETIEGIIPIMGLRRWHLAFQNRGGREGGWLDPEPRAVLEELFREGYGKILVCPIGFISDHLETLYDLDITLKAWAAEQGIEIIRTPCLNDAPELIKVLCQLVEEALEGK